MSAQVGAAPTVALWLSRSTAASGARACDLGAPPAMRSSQAAAREVQHLWAT